jgi:hypothetical protein
MEDTNATLTHRAAQSLRLSRSGTFVGKEFTLNQSQMLLECRHGRAPDFLMTVISQL